MTNQMLRTRIAGAVALLVIATAALCAVAADDPEATAAKAFELRMAGQVDEAVEMLEAALAGHELSGVLYFELARAKLLLLDIGGTHDAAAAAVQHAPDNNDYRYFAAMTSLYSLIDAAHHGDKDRMKEMGQESMDQLEAILAADPDHYEARYLFVQQSVDMAPEVGLEVGDTEAHVKFLEEKDPIMGAKARCCFVDKEEQKKIWEKVLADHPEECRALVEAAEGLIKAGDLDQAEACLGKAMAKDKESCYALLGLGFAYFKRNDWDRAAELTQQYLDTGPPVALEAYAVGRMGMIHIRKGDRERGEELMSEAREMDPHVWQTVMPPPWEIFTPLES
jgi:tetratricopeptide (TPR) repeat protein